MPGTSGLPARGVVMALDWGARRIGVAIGDLEVRMAHPLTVLNPSSHGQDLDLIDALIQQWQPVALVVGLPARSDGRAHPLAGRCRAFGQRLGKRFNLPVHWVDEELSSWAADQLLRETQHNWRDRKARVDAMAAQQILETFFERTTGAA